KHNRGSSQENLALASAQGDRKKRHQELIKNALSGIKDGEAHAVEISAAFEGKKDRKEYVMGVAYASSPVSSDARFLAYFNNQTYQPQPQHVQIGLQRSKSAPSMEVGVQVDMSFPKVPLVNFREALAADPTSKISGRVDFVSGQKQQPSGYISLEGVLSSSPQRKDYLQSHPLAKLCQKQMEQGLKVQPACSNVTIRANYLDSYRFTVS
ncbi:hypothetical protein OV760_26965, partial [Salmonella enterica subsp. enterica serovar 1,4,[5],12:i:-]|nr:hypothetical protein [Salmonella enterica subsp. enterica serovar 1,4,[5],12:i:-]